MSLTKHQISFALIVLLGHSSPTAAATNDSAGLIDVPMNRTPPAPSQEPPTVTPEPPTVVPYPGMKLGEGPGGGITVGRVTEVSIADLPPAMQHSARRALALRSSKPAAVEAAADNDGFWPEPLTRIVPEPGAQTPGRLSFHPVELRGLNGSDLSYLGAEALDDAKPGEPILTAMRFFQRADGVKVGLLEDDFTQGGAVILVKELQNARVGRHPAELAVQQTPSGRVRTLLSWADTHTHYTLIVEDDVDHPHGWAKFDREWLLSIAASLGT